MHQCYDTGNGNDDDDDGDDIIISSSSSIISIIRATSTKPVGVNNKY